jgi:predicted double-glycine peptidase
VRTLKENAKIYNLSADIINRNSRQMYLCRRMIKKPAGKKAQFERIWKNDVFALKEQYTMSD